MLPLPLILPLLSQPASSETKCGERKEHPDFAMINPATLDQSYQRGAVKATRTGTAR
jgi:hypothetical protein